MQKVGKRQNSLFAWDYMSENMGNFNYVVNLAASPPPSEILARLRKMSGCPPPQRNPGYGPANVMCIAFLFCACW